MRIPGRRERLRLLEEAFSQGIRHYDVARSYGLGATEAELGRFLRGKRDAVVIATKFGLPLPPLARAVRVVQRPARAVLARAPRARSAAQANPATHASDFRFDPLEARESLEKSMQRMGVDRVDILLLHDPSPNSFDPDDVRTLLDDLCERGYIGRWGVAGEPARTQDAVTALQRPDLVIQTRADGLANRVPSIVRDADITYGVLARAMSTILAHTRADSQTRRRWHEETGFDCGDNDELAILLLEEALRARQGRVVLMSTTQRSRVAAARLAGERALGAPGRATSALRRLIASEISEST